MRNWLLGLPWPLWTLFACKPFSPWCLIDDVAHAWFPMTFGFWSERVNHSPLHEPWICERHNASVDRWARKKYQEDFDGDL
jgi:hypothetical protein